MAICLPGIASRVKRAATSAARPEPLVMTANWMTTRIRKITRPITREPPTTKWPKASMTSPAYPSRSTRRVEATFRPRRNRVSTRTRLGKIDRSSGLVMKRVVMSTSSDMTMLTLMSTSSSAGGNGTTSSMMMPTTRMGAASLTSDVLRTHHSSGTGAAPGARWKPAAAPRRRSDMTNARTRATDSNRSSGISWPTLHVFSSVRASMTS